MYSACVFVCLWWVERAVHLTLLYPCPPCPVLSLSLRLSLPVATYPIPCCRCRCRCHLLLSLSLYPGPSPTCLHRVQEGLKYISSLIPGVDDPDAKPQKIPEKDRPVGQK